MIPHVHYLQQNTNSGLLLIKYRLDLSTFELSIVHKNNKAVKISQGCYSRKNVIYSDSYGNLPDRKFPKFQIEVFRHIPTYPRGTFNVCRIIIASREEQKPANQNFGICNPEKFAM